MPLPSEATAEGAAPMGPENGTDEPFFPVAHSTGYHTATSWRFLESSWTEPGSAIVWMRMDVPLVEGEIPAPLERVLVAADSVSGAASLLDSTEYTFPNLDLSAQLIRDPVGEWTALEARSESTAGHTGAAYSKVYDQYGFAGSTRQTPVHGQDRIVGDGFRLRLAAPAEYRQETRPVSIWERRTGA